MLDWILASITAYENCDFMPFILFLNALSIVRYILSYLTVCFDSMFRWFQYIINVAVVRA